MRNDKPEGEAAPNLRQTIRWGIVRTHHLPGFREAYRRFCRSGIERVVRHMTEIPGIEAIYSRHRHLASENFIPGESDLDLTLVAAADRADDPSWLVQAFEEIRRLASAYVFLTPGDVRIVTRAELARLRDQVSPETPLHRCDEWTLLAGVDVREGSGPEPPFDRIPWHPQFQKWWQGPIQDHVLGGPHGVAAHYLHPVFRGAVENRRLLLAAGGPPGKRGEDEGSESDLDALLGKLEARNYWSRDPASTCIRIFAAVLRETVAFHASAKSLPLEPNPRRARARRDAEHHRLFFGRIRSMIQSRRELGPLLGTVLAYPEPYCYPYRYRVDVILPEGIDAEHLGMLAVHLGECFGGRRFHIGAAAAKITLLPSEVFGHPLSFLGVPAPFLREHLQQHARIIYGSGTTPPRGMLTHDTMLEWCRLFLPVHRSKFRRRVHADARPAGIAQLAAMRLFLETGEIATDLPSLLDRYAERFPEVAGSRAGLERLFVTPPTTDDPSTLGAAFRFLWDEYERVESLLSGAHVAR